MKKNKLNYTGKASIILYISFYIFMVYPLASAFMKTQTVTFGLEDSDSIAVHAIYLPIDFAFLKEIPVEEKQPEPIEIFPEVVEAEQYEVKEAAEPVMPLNSEDKPEEYSEAAAVDAPTGENDTALSASSLRLNEFVLDIIKSYKIGSYPYLLNNDYSNYNGVTTKIVYKNQVLAKAHPSGSKASHCVGITFEVFFKAMQERNKALGIDSNNFNDMTWAELHDFMLMWYVAGPKVNNNCASAVEKYGLGRRITNLEEAQAGDFIDFSRENGTGHAAIFLEWIREEGQIVGFRYWSSQPSTKGIDYNTEYFNIRKENSSKYGNVMTNHFYIARIHPVSEYRKFR